MFSKCISGFLFLLFSLNCFADKAKFFSTQHIQQCIDSLHSIGQGKVIIPKGTHTVGTIFLKSGVELHLEKGAMLKSTQNMNELKWVSNTTATNKWKSLIIAKDAENISITGEGTIDGSGAAIAHYLDSLFYRGMLDSSLYQLQEKRPVAHVRPQIIQFVNCKNVRIEGITIQNGSSWLQCYDMCKHLTINNIRVLSNTYWNNDGIDIVDCQNVKITNSFFDVSDDGICFKSYIRNNINTRCDSVYVANCKVRSSASAVKLGTSSYGGFTNFLIENIFIYDTYRSAIAIENWEGGLVENITVRNIKAKNTGNAIFIKLNHRGKYNNPIGTLRNILIEHVKAEIPFEQPDYYYPLPGPALPFFHNVFPASVSGIPGGMVENVVLRNISITYPGRGNASYANIPAWRLKDVPEKIEEYPEFSMFGELPAWGFYFRHIDGLVLENVRLKIRHTDYRPAVIFDDVKNLNTKFVKIKKDEKEEHFVFEPPVKMQ
ncbi:MAG: glycoside hydrolase family 28 protein [Flavobacteriales bacterium]|nr:glycoside hydrolase family 28 protein [Flavobacteriales bacterium]